MKRKTIVTALSTTVLGFLIIVGCTVTGVVVVDFFFVDTGNDEGGVPSQASISVSLICNDARNQFRSHVTLVDNTNGARINANLPWTPVEDLGQGMTTCEEGAEYVQEVGVSVTLSLITSKGQENGFVAVAVGEPGLDPEDCGDLQPVIVQAQETTPTNLPGGSYFAEGCLDHGKIVFN